MLIGNAIQFVSLIWSNKIVSFVKIVNFINKIQKLNVNL